MLSHLFVQNDKEQHKIMSIQYQIFNNGPMTFLSRSSYEKDTQRDGE